MPTYDYACSSCGPFEAMRPIAERDRSTPCPGCSRPAPRVLGGAARLGSSVGGAGDARHRLIARQERALGEGSYRRMRHPMACGCCR